MEKEEPKNDENSTNAPLTLPGAPGGEDIKDNDQSEDDLIDNIPDSHPGPSKKKKS